MNFEKFRRTGELSDITVVVDKTEFKLHTFPLFTKSEYFKNVVASSKSSPPYVIRLDNDFPGGAAVFNQLSDYFYSIPITIDQNNIVSLRSAAAFVQCDSLSVLLDERINKLLLVARAKHDLNIPLTLLEQCTGEYQQWAKQTEIIDKCFQSIIESLSYGVGLKLNKSDRELIVHLPVEWIIEIINLCPAERKFSILPIAKHYMTIHVIDKNQLRNSSSLTNENDHQTAFSTVKKKDIPITTDDEKREILDQIIKALDNTVEQLPLTWLNSAYEKSVELNCQCQSALSYFITQAFLNSSQLDENMENIPDDVMATLLERISKHKQDHIKDSHVLEKLSTLIDSYVEQLRQRGALTSEQFVKLASFIPKEQRNSHDSLLLALDDILKNEKSTQLSTNEREELLSHIDFSRVNEETIAACKTNQLIPQQLIADAALALCTKLRTELDETRARLRLTENELYKSRPTYTSSNYRSRYYDSSSASPSRYSVRSRNTYLNSYDLPLSSSTYSYSRFDSDNDVDCLFPSRYSTLSSTNRYGSYSSYYY